MRARSGSSRRSYRLQKCGCWWGRKAALPRAAPALQRSEAEIAVVRAQAAQARVSDATDLTLEAGYKYEAAEDVNTLVFGAIVPLNFTRNGRDDSHKIR